MPTVIVREYALLTTGSVPSGSLDVAQVSDSAFDWLCMESARLQAGGAALVQVEDRRSLRLASYVGVIETPCGTRIEILPKSVDAADGAPASRRLLRRMLSACMNVHHRESAATDIQTFEAPLSEWVMRHFLELLQRLVKRGVRFDYHTVQAEEQFLRGRLDLNRQLRQPPGRGHWFQVEHAVFDSDCAENRLLRAALDRVCRLTRDATNWRLSHELAVLLAPIPPSTDVAGDFRRWRTDRLLAHYQPIRPWCALMLGDESPLALAGSWHGNSLLFPMETLFERYVEVCLRRSLPPGAVLQPSPRRHHLATHQGQRWFTLVPDFLLSIGGTSVVLDTKWKRLDSSLGSPNDKYGLSQADFYQLFAYGERYLGGVGDLLLVYPRTDMFSAPMPVFELGPSLRLWVTPFDLELGALVDTKAIAWLTATS